MAKGKHGVTTTVESGHEFTPKEVQHGSQARRELSLWWALPRPGEKAGDGSTAKVHDSLLALLDHLKGEQKQRLDRFSRYMRLYGGRDFTRLDAKGYNKSNNPDRDSMVAFNGIQSVVDTMMSKIAKNKPVPTFLTEGGNFDERMKARKLSRYVSGVFYDQDVYEKSRYVTKGAGILGSGCFYPYRDGDRVAVEWVFPVEIFVDDVEAFYGRPGNIYREKHVPRAKLLELFSEHEEAIRAAQASGDTAGSQMSLDHVRVVEGWHFASGHGARDGRHVIAIDKATLEDEVYTKPYDPFVWLHWSDPLIGWWGRGLPEELQGLQVEVNRLLIKIQRSFHLASVPWVLVPKNANVSTADIRNEIGLVLKYAGNVAPRVQTHQSVSAEVFMHLERLIRLMYEKAGISQLTASSKKPAGLESGIALREYHDIETERLILFGQAHERMFLDLARRIVDISREIAADTKAREGHGKLKVRAPGRRDFETIAWDKVDLADERYVMQVFPVSSLPSSPAGRKEEVMDMLAAGFLDLPVALQLLDYPDLTAEKNIQLAALENIDWTISKILEDGEYRPPEPFQNLSMGLARMNSAYLMARTDGAPEERLNMMRRWMLSASSLIAASQPPPPAQAPPAGEPESGGAPAPDMTAAA